MFQTVKLVLKESAFFVWSNLFYRSGVKRNFSNFEIKIPFRVNHWFSDNYEQKNIDFIKKIIHPSWNVLDLGANVGIYSIILSELVGEKGRVFAFEPTKSTFKYLKLATKWNTKMNITLENKAVGKETGYMNFFYSSEPGGVANSLISYKNNAGSSYQVSVIALDDYFDNSENKIHFIKIDVEGSEIDVLKGSYQIIKNQRPMILLAVHPSIIIENGQSLAELYEILHSNSYHVYYNDDLLTPEIFTSMKNLFDVRCIPSEVLPKFRAGQ